jgi:hypothetical protein
VEHHAFDFFKLHVCRNGVPVCDEMATLSYVEVFNFKFYTANVLECVPGDVKQTLRSKQSKFKHFAVREADLHERVVRNTVDGLVFLGVDSVVVFSELIIVQFEPSGFSEES